MTILVQLHDCHSCYDERSIDQKKIGSIMMCRRHRTKVPAEVIQVAAHEMDLLAGL